MISKWRIASLIGLCLVSTLTCGFSSWIYVVNNKTDVGDIDVNVGNITTNSTATIIFKKAKLFSFNKYGFAHEEEILVNGHKQTITYFDYSYSISTVWQINPTTVTSFEYRTTQKYASSYDFISYSDSNTNNKCTVTSYAQFDSETFTGSGTGSNSTIAFKKKNPNPTNNYLDFTVTIPQFSSTQYILITYQNIVTGLSDAEFESKVFNGSINRNDGHGNTVPVTFDFTLNKVGV